MDLALPGLELKTLDPCFAGWRMRVVPALGHLAVRMITNGVVDRHLRRHDLRHTGLTWFADAGVQVHVLRRIAGRGSLTTTQRYLHPDVHKITAAGAALSAHLSVVRAPRSLPGPIVMTR
ncbi:tyrosine-type recombinase/integrase [Streptomyces sp. NBC_01591]|nr:tyrosine-type recombinase/integrase [Streptomyces sp. NBC_01591]